MAPGRFRSGLYTEDGQGAYPQASPDMHDDSISTLHEVLRTHRARAGRAVQAGRAVSPLRIEFIAGFEISEAEIADVVAFLESLSDKRFLRDARHADPWPTSPVPPP